MKLLLLLAGLIFQPGEGQFRADAPRQTQGWIGLYCDETCQLRPASLVYAVDPRSQDRLDAESKPKGALVVFRDIAGLTAGPIDEAIFDDPDNSDLRKGSVVRMQLNAETYELRVTAANDRLEKGVVTLHHDGVSQDVFRMPDFIDEGHLALHFAGDLDRDGKLDLIMSNSPKYSYYPLQLYLSSAARPGELVREVARGDRYSC